MNILLGALFLLGGIMIGSLIAKKYKAKYEFLSSFYAFLEYLETNFNFLQDSIKVVLDNKKQSFCNDFNDFLNDLSQNLDNQQDFLTKWSTQQKFLNQNEVLVFTKFFEQLGRLDCQTQIESIKQTKQALSECVQLAKDAHTKKGKLSTQLGLMCGLTLFIIVL